MTGSTARPLVALAVAAATCALVRARPAQLDEVFWRWLDHPAIRYHEPAADPVAQLSRRLEDGSAALDFSGPSGYLASLLEALDIDSASQILVFAQDSVQRARISAANPRALYFNDSVAVGWMPGGFIEIAAQDPRNGTVFYTLEQHREGRPAFQRRDDCLSCHYSFTTTGVPGMLARSAGHFTVDHRVPLEERWGGWYVTGDAGALRHRGNVDLDRLFTAPPAAGRDNWPSIDGHVDPSAYLTNQSDLAALLVFEHQMHGMNLLARLGWEARVAAADPKAETVPLDEAAIEVVDYLLFVDEPPLPGPMHGSTRFATTFAARGPFDRQGRSLRQLDLTKRLMRYPCSFLVYSPEFDALPLAAKDAIYARLRAVLSGHATGEKYASLSEADRTAVLEILRETKGGFEREAVSRKP